MHGVSQRGCSAEVSPHVGGGMCLQQAGLVARHLGLLGCLIHGSSPEEEMHVQMGACGGSKGRG